MILHHILICLLICAQTILGQPLDKLDNVEIKTDAFVGNNLPPASNTFLSDESVGALLGKVTELSNRYKKDMTGTVADLQKMIDTDLSLPRLTRGEIIDLLENLTRADPAVIREKVIKTREEYQRALMLVMPYTPKKGDAYNMEELYTRPPITHIVGEETDKPITRKPYIPKRNVEIMSVTSTTSPIKTSTLSNFANYVNLGLNVANEPSSAVTKKSNKQIETKQVEPKPIELKPVQTKQVEAKQVDERPKPMRRPLRVKPTRYPNHKYPEDTTMASSNNGIKIVSPPSLVTDSDNMNVDYWHYTQTTPKQSKPVDQIKPHRQLRPSAMQSSVYKSSVTTTARPRVRSTYTTSTTTSTTPYPLKNINVPFEIKDVSYGQMKPLSSTPYSLKNIDVPLEMKDALKDVHFGPIKPSSQKFSSHYDGAMANFPKEEPVTENVRDLLESIGVLPVNGALPTVMPDISNVADNLSPEMRDLLMTFGLIENPDQGPIEEPYAAPYTQKQFPNEPGSYSQFKPLPDSVPYRQDMEEFLAEYGLVGNSQRSSKAIKDETPKVLSKVPNIDMDMIPESMHSVLEDIGLTQKRAKKLLLDDIKNENGKTHVFSPDNHYVSDEEIKRLNQLLETIKKLEKMNRTATFDDLKDLDVDNIKELTNILKQDASIPLDLKNFGPDPLDFDFGGEKNEVKRQESTTITATTETSTSPTEEPNNASLAALAESFGGPAASSSDVVDESLPPPRKTGFYYLLDWNSFLEVGEEGKDKVNIRFSPQAGDASRFLRINVP